MNVKHNNAQDNMLVAGTLHVSKPTDMRDIAALIRVLDASHVRLSGATGNVVDRLCRFMSFYDVTPRWRDKGEYVTEITPLGSSGEDAYAWAKKFEYVLSLMLHDALITYIYANVKPDYASIFPGWRDKNLDAFIISALYSYVLDMRVARAEQRGRELERIQIKCGYGNMSLEDIALAFCATLKNKLLYGTRVGRRVTYARCYIRLIFRRIFGAA